jgi:hypothetical protein
MAQHVRQATKPDPSSAYLPAIFRTDGPYGDIIRKVDWVYQSIMEFLTHNLNWLREPGGIRILLIKLPDAIVSISKRIGPATRIPGKIINSAAEILMPIHKLGPCASSLLGFAEVGAKLPAMLNPSLSLSQRQVEYVVKDANGNSYRAQFPLNYWEQKSNNIQNIADWTISFTGCAGYIWRLNHTTAEKFPLADIATWSARYMSIKGLYFEGRFLYETLWVGDHQKSTDGGQTYIPIVRWDSTKQVRAPVQNATVIWQEVAGSVLRITLSVACLSLDIFKELAAKGNSSLWLNTAIFCAGLAPTFIQPVALRYWPKMVVERRYLAARA